MKTSCCWCGSGFTKIKDHFWCSSLPCRSRQATYAVGAKDQKQKWQFLYVPLPRQVEYEQSKARNLLAGGAAGTTKSHGLRWRLYRRALRIPNFEGLILRKTWNELEKHHLRLMEREARVFQSFGIPAVFQKTDRELRFPNGSVIEGGHLENPDDVEKYLSRERDEINVDEGSTFPPGPLLELSTRARTSKPEVEKDGGARFGVYTNPGGPAAIMLRDLFIDHTPDLDAYPALGQLDSDGQPFYRPDEWQYIPGRLEDNPYLPDSYERDLAVLSPHRYRQLRHNDWDVMAGQFFAEFNAGVHVKNLGNPSADVEWFRSLDWGYVAPGVCLWWACLPDGRLYVRNEYKFQYRTISEVCGEIARLTGAMGVRRVRYTASDPALWQRTGQTGEAMAETFQRAGIPLRKSVNDRVNGWQRVRELLRLRPDNEPWLVIHPDCRYLVRTMAAAISDKNSPDDVDTNCDDHAIDSLRYGAMSRPSPTIISKSRPYSRHAVGRLFRQAREAVESYA